MNVKGHIGFGHQKFTFLASKFFLLSFIFKPLVLDFLIFKITSRQINFDNWLGVYFFDCNIKGY